MRMRVTKPIPGHDRDFPVGTAVNATPCRFVKRCFNLLKPGAPLVPLSTVPIEYLQEAK